MIDLYRVSKRLLIIGSLVRAQQAEPIFQRLSEKSLGLFYYFSNRLLIKIISVILIFPIISACQSMPKGEWGYQTVHAVDVLQTLNGPVKDDCYMEGHPITRKIIGPHPSENQVIAWGIGKGVLHYGISSYLEDSAPSWAYVAWQVVSTGSVALVVHDNFALGVKPWGENDHSKAGNWCSR